MKKFNIKLKQMLSAALLAAVATSVFISCKKEQSKLAFNVSQTETKTEAQLVYEKIVKFTEAREAYHNNARTDNGYVTTDEARSILDAAINYEFSDMNRRLEDTELDTLRYAAPATDAEGNVAVNDIIDIFDRFVSNIGGEANSVNYFMILYPQANTRTNDVEIVFTRGTTPPTPTPIPDLDYFGEDDNWIWAFDNGRCDIGGYSDAAQQLGLRCAAMLPAPISRDTINIYNGFAYDIDYQVHSAFDLQSNISGLDYWLFHAENVPYDEVSTYCITYDYMNLYLRSLHANVILNTGIYHYSPVNNSSIREICISPYHNHYYLNDDNDNNNIGYVVKLIYYKVGSSR